MRPTMSDTPDDFATRERRREAMKTLDPTLLGGRFRCFDEIGRGALGVVHKALDTESGATVAIKFLQQDGRTDGSVLDRLVSEVQMARQLDHPAICEVLGLNGDKGRPFLAMELLRGPTFHDYLLEQGGMLPFEVAYRYLKPVGDALDYAHAKGVIHLDLKPDNLQFDLAPDSGGRLKVLDFGLARKRVTDIGRGESDQRLGGSRAYCSPEQTKGATPRPGFDQFALAATFYEALAGRPPFCGDAAEEAKAKGSIPRSRQIHSRLFRVLARAMSPRPGDRYPNLAEFFEAMRRAEEEGPGKVLAIGVLVFAIIGTFLLLASF